MSLAQSISTFCDRLQASPVSVALQETSWVVPAIQTVHILSVATLISSALFVTLRLLGVAGRDLNAARVATRFLPVIWWTLPVLLVTGSILIIAEPARSLQNPAFYLKMGLLLGASLLTIAYQLPLRRDNQFWEGSALRVVATKLIGVVSIALWAGVILAGRWIAYVGNL